MNRVYLVQTRSFRDLSAARQAQIESACAMVVGAKTFQTTSLSNTLNASDFKDGVIVLPTLIPTFENDVADALRVIEKFQPNPVIFGLAIVLVTDEGCFNPDTLGDPFWISTLDEFYDQAVPTSFVVLHKDLPQVQIFHVSAAISGLLRDVDNLRELRRIAESVEDLESRVDNLEARKNASNG